MSNSDEERVLERARTEAVEDLRRLNDRPVRASARYDDLVRELDRPLPEHSSDGADVLAQVISEISPGLVASAGPRYFGFVTGGAYPAAMAADWLVSAWDQNTALHVMSPAMSALETITARWILEALGLPDQAGVGFVTGAHMANVTALAAARHEMLRRARWDVEALGLQGAPALTTHRRRGSALVHLRGRASDRDWQQDHDSRRDRRSGPHAA